MLDFNKFILNEEIIANGKSLDTDDDKKNTQNFTADTPDGDDPPAEPPENNPDDTPPEDTPPEDNPNYTDDTPEDPDDTNPEDTPPEDNSDDPDYTADTPDDTEDGGNPEDNPDPGLEDDNPDYTADTPEDPDDTNPEDTPPEDNSDDPDNGGNPEDNPDGDNPDDNPDYMSDSPDGTDADGDAEDPNAGQDDGTGEDQGNMSDDEIKQLETDLFSDMTPEQIAIKQTELKTQFVSLYGNIERIVERLSKVNRVEDNIRPLEFITKKLLDLKDLVRDSLIQSFDTRSYVENQIILQQQMGIFAMLTNILEELGKKKK